MRGRNPSADSAAGMAGAASGRLRKQPFWPPGDKSRGLGGGPSPQRSKPSLVLRRQDTLDKAINRLPPLVGQGDASTAGQELPPLGQGKPL